MALTRGWIVGLLGLGLLGGVGFIPKQAIAQSCVANTSCPAQPLQVTPGQWITFEIINRTGSIVSIEQPSVLEAIALSPQQRWTLGGSTKDNASLLFWSQGPSVEARVHRLSDNVLKVEFLPGGGHSHYGVYLKDDGTVEVL